MFLLARINWKLEGWEETIDTAYKAFQETVRFETIIILYVILGVLSS